MDYLCAFEHIIVPVAKEFAPDLIIVSAGFDAAEGDFMGECCVTPQGFAYMTAALKKVARIVLLLEGGYNLDVTARCTEACLKQLLEPPPSIVPRIEQKPTMIEVIRDVLYVQAEFWRCLRKPHEYEESIQDPMLACHLPEYSYANSPEFASDEIESETESQCSYSNHSSQDDSPFYVRPASVWVIDAHSRRHMPLLDIGHKRGTSLVVTDEEMPDSPYSRLCAKESLKRQKLL